MAFQFNQIDKISDVDQALKVLEEDYIPELLEIFIHSPEGQAYLQAHPELSEAMGIWAGNFVYFAYGYLNVTLPKLKEPDAQEVMLRLFPRKIALVDPDEADSIIPELIAFWEFLHREYQQHYSKKILAFLHKIQPTFKATMNNPQNFGIARSFLEAGQAAGFDMTTEEGIEAYQQHYNQQLQETGATPPGFPALQPLQSRSGTEQNPLAAFPIPEGVPPEFVALLSQQLGFGAFPGLEHLPSDPKQLAEAIAHHLVESGEVTLTPSSEADGGDDFFKQLQANTLEQGMTDQGVALSEAEIALLHQQVITETEPGTIVKDFETVLAAIGDRGVPVGGNLNQLPSKTLVELNHQLSQPIQVEFQRPKQKSYPNLHGLYLLLRATGLTQFVCVGKTTYLKLNPEIFAVWQTLNPTEKYFTLLEAWLIRGDGELLGDDRSRLKQGTRVLHAWSDWSQQSRRKSFKNYAEQSLVTYWPGLHNLALMQLFGWVEITAGKPEAGKGWRFKKIQTLPLGNAIASMVLHAYLSAGLDWNTQTDSTQPWGELQPYFQPFFPEWQQNLAPLPAPEHQTGTYIFKVSLDQIWRRLAISSEATLEDLGDLIRQSVGFDSDHLDMFSFKDAIGHTVEVFHPRDDWADGASTNAVKVGDLPLKPGLMMTYLFDFGDNWKFSVLLEEIQPDLPKRRSNPILEVHGKAPEQYPAWDE